MVPIRKGDGTGLAAKGYSQVRKGDGTVLWNAIPDSGVYLDDWLDNQISNRSLYSDLQYEFNETAPDESGFDTEPERPNWVENQSTVETDEGTLILADADEEIIDAQLPDITVPDNFTMRFDFQMQNETTRSGRVMVFSFMTDQEGQEFPNEESGIIISPEGSEWDCSFAADGDTFLNSPTFDDPLDDHTIQIIREDGSEWSLVVDGSTVDTGSKDYDPQPNFQTISSRNGPETHIYRWELF